MKVSVFFYQNIDRESVLFRRLSKLKSRHEGSYWIGSVAGFGVDNLTWTEAFTLAASLLVNILKSDSASVFEEMRLLVQKDGP